MKQEDHMGELGVPRKTIRVAVLTAHIVFVLALGYTSWMQLDITPKPKSVMVSLIQLKPPAIAPPVAPPAPAPTLEAPPQPAPPPTPAPTLTKPTPTPTPPKPVPTKPKPPKPAPTKPKPTKPVATLTKPAPKPPPKSTWKPRTKDQIRNTESYKAAQRKASRPRLTIDATSLVAGIKQQVSAANSLTVTGVPGKSTSSDATRYYDIVGAHLHNLWEEPNRSEVGGGRPTVGVSVTVSADGRVIGKRITDRSREAAMNISVATVLKGLASLPAPSAYGVKRSTLEIRVTFELR